MMTEALVIGGVTGLALFLAVFALLPRRVSLAGRIAAFDASRVSPLRDRAVEETGSESALTRRLGGALERFCAELGWEFPSLRANLRLTGKSFESFLGTKALLGIFGLMVPLFLLSGLSLLGLHLSLIVPVWVGLIFAAVFFFLPDLELRGEVEKRRRDFRHAIGAFLDLVAMNLSGGRGVPEALMSASEIGDGQLGADVRVDELRDLAGALSLVAEDGAKVRESLTARAVSLRRKELADLEGQAAERSQSMLVAQLVMAGAFLVFLIYPAVQVLLHS
jgi:tight adherence protein C